MFAAGERTISEVMVPRTEVVFLEAGLSVGRAVKTLLDSPHSRYPVIDGSQDDVIGFVHIRDLVLAEGDRSRTVRDHMREVARLPGTKKVLIALSEMRRGGDHLAIVVDEYGGTDGIVTLEDLIEEVIGDIRDEYDEDEVRLRRLAGGEVEVDARSNLDEFAERTGQNLPPGPYETAGGYVMARLGRLPNVGDVAEGDGFTLTVTTVDGRRAGRLQFRSNPEAGRRGGRPRDDKAEQRADSRRQPGRARAERRNRRPDPRRRRPNPRPRRRRFGADRWRCQNPSTWNPNQHRATPNRLLPPRIRPARGCCPASSRPPIPCTWATTSARFGNGSGCRTATRRSTASSTCTP